MSDQVIIWYEKHDDRVTPAKDMLKVFNERYEDGYWYENYEEGDPKTEWGDRAKAIYDAQDEAAAVTFLYERADGEYEGFEVKHLS